jgi:REP element-mobilizing transposase RayT
LTLAAAGFKRLGRLSYKGGSVAKEEVLMRKARIKVIDQTAVYHCVSRVVGGQFLLDDLCKETFRLFMWQQADFAGLQILTYCLMTSHTHILVRVPRPSEVSDAELVERVQVLYGTEARETVRLREDLERGGRIPRKLRERLLKRMGDVSAFMKELKQRFSRWYNENHDRFGTLWAERFKSVLVEDESEALRTSAAYIDLNPMRAGLVQDPKDYRYSGYGEAVGGMAKARAGLLSVVGQTGWDRGAAEYRVQLYVAGGQAGESGKVVLDRAQILKVQRAGGAMGCAEALRLRIRYFTDGLALGSEAYVNEVFWEFRSRFGPRRRSGARRLRGLPFVELRTLRDLKKDVVS